MSTKKPGPFLGALDVSLDLPLADLGSRSIAYFIDWLLIVFVVLFGWLMAQWAGLTDLLFEGDDPAAALTVLAFLMAGSYFLFELLWFVGFEQAWGGLTPGKRWMGLRVVSREGAQVGLLSSLLRNLLRPIDQLPGSWSVAAFSMLVGEHRQRLGDLVAGTVVVVEPRETVHVHLGRLPPGLGEPVFDRLDADIAHAMMGINAVKGVEIGAGFASIAQTGSEHRDGMSPEGFLANNAGGVVGGISTGQDILVSLAIKPTSSIRLPGPSIDASGAPLEVVTHGRHDPCVGIRATPIAEAMLALVLMDHWLRHRAQNADVQCATPRIPAAAPAAGA
jgi:uncharacterized RDD family membrane protein YckC